MKKISIYLIIILVFSCSSNDFYETKKYFETDKEVYSINDDFEITVFIYPTQKEKIIRFKKAFDNLYISFIPHSEYDETSQTLKKHFIEGPSIFGDDSEFIDEYIITDKKPFEKVFRGRILELNDEIIFEIPELNVKQKLQNSQLLKSPIVIIQGHCRTIQSGIEEPFIPKEIQINID